MADSGGVPVGDGVSAGVPEFVLVEDPVGVEVADGDVVEVLDTVTVLVELGEAPILKVAVGVID